MEPRNINNFDSCSIHIVLLQGDWSQVNDHWMLVGFDVRAKITSVQNAALLFCSSNKLCLLDDIFNLWLLYFGLFGLF